MRAGAGTTRDHLIEAFHPAVAGWFRERFGAPTDAQALAWPRVAAGGDVLLAAPTGSGKTLAAFLVTIDRLLRAAASGPLPERIEVVYVSPLKALSSDIRRNLEEPLAGISERARALGLADPGIRTALRTGDTTASARREILTHPPHILITTPESLYLMLTAERSRPLLRGVRTVIVDEIHALLRDKRGSHLALSLARLDHVAESRPSRIGLSATIRPMEAAARFLVGSDRTVPDGRPECAILDAGHQRDLDLAIEVPGTDLTAVASAEQWKDIYDRLAELIRAHRTTLVFVNTRRLAERASHHLAERLGREMVGAHHGSLARDRRFDVEERLKTGRLKALVATASLELGIDIGAIDLVCQLEAPRGVSTFLQRVGRSGHALGRTPKGRLFPTTRDELVECAALVGAVRAGRLEPIAPPIAPLDVLAQQIAAECACEDWGEDALFAMLRRAAPYADLAREDFDAVVEMLSEGIATGMGRSAWLLHRDRIHRVLRGRRGARRVAIESSGAIPDTADFRVILEPEGTPLGTVNEDFATESMAGDVFLLGTTSWRIRKIEPGLIRVEDGRGAIPNIPFWVGEAPGRSRELSEEVASLRAEVARREDAAAWLARERGAGAEAGAQIVRYIRAGEGAIGLVPTQEDVVFERFFDESGGMQLVLHAPFGTRINRAWGLALRKRYCRTFDFELQAAAGDDAILLSMGAQQSFPLEDLFALLRSETIEETLAQAALASPLFTTRWRWNAVRALALPRQRHGKKVPPNIQRMRAEDLLAAVFPKQVACQENVTGPIAIPDHPLVRQSLHDCLHEAMDLEGLHAILARIESGEIRLHARTTTEPSPFAHEILNSKPYTFLDDAPLEERRARAVTLRRILPDDARDLGALDPAAIERVRSEASPAPRGAEELHESLLGLVVTRPLAEWSGWFDELVRAGRAGIARLGDGSELWLAAERWPLLARIFPRAEIRPVPDLPLELAEAAAGEEEALALLVRGQTETRGPLTVGEIATATGLEVSRVAIGLARLEAEGAILRGRFRPGAGEEEYCDRRLLARIHRSTLDRLRREIEPVAAADYLRFLLRWQRLDPGARRTGKRGVLETIAQLQGFEAPAAAWEARILPSRVESYDPTWLDELCWSGQVAWARLGLPGGGAAQPPTRAAGATAATPISLVLRRDLPHLLAGARGDAWPEAPAKGVAHIVWEALRTGGAQFEEDLAASTRRLRTEVERALAELLARGLVTADGFQALRALAGARRRERARRRRSGASMRRSLVPVPAGRWSLLRPPDGALAPEEVAAFWAGQLLDRYGVVFRDVIARESLAIPWREVLLALRRLEARGEVRGGRFVAGFYGEQYARSEALGMLRSIRREAERDAGARVGGASRTIASPAAPAALRLSAADPLNLIGILTPGPRAAALHTSEIEYADGLPRSVEEAGAGRSRGRA